MLVSFDRTGLALQSLLPSEEDCFGVGAIRRAPVALMELKYYEGATRIYLMASHITTVEDDSRGDSRNSNYRTALCLRLSPPIVEERVVFS